MIGVFVWLHKHGVAIAAVRMLSAGGVSVNTCRFWEHYLQHSVLVPAKEVPRGSRRVLGARAIHWHVQTQL